MAFLGGTFDANNVEPSAPVEIFPPGKYIVQIVQSEMRDTKAGGGQMLWLELEIVDGPAKGRKLWDRLNLVNPNQKAVEIAQRTLSAICHAVGKLQVSDSEELHFKPMLATVNVETDSRDGDKPAGEQRKQNVVKGYAATGGGQAFAAPRPQTAAPAQPAPAPAARQPMANAPWRRSA
jgi:hypothetical protein